MRHLDNEDQMSSIPTGPELLKLKLQFLQALVYLQAWGSLQVFTRESWVFTRAPSPFGSYEIQLLFPKLYETVKNYTVSAVPA